MTDDLVKRLRTSWDTQRSIMLQTDAWMSERHLAADRIEQLTAERDEAWAYMSAVQGDLYDAITIEAERDRLREVLVELVQHTHNCERELTEDLHHVDFCGESVPLTNAREALKGETP